MGEKTIEAEGAQKKLSIKLSPDFSIERKKKQKKTTVNTRTGSQSPELINRE